MDRLQFQEKTACESNQFCRFINHSDQFVDSEKAYLIQLIVTDQFTRILYVSGILAIWSVVAATIDSILFPGIIVYAIFHGVIDYKVLIPPLLFLLVNGGVKFFYIFRSLKGKVRFWDMLIAALPYAGSAYLLKKILINDKLMNKAIGLYLKNKKSEFKKQVFRRIKP